MARIAGVDLPRDKRVEIGLTYIYGIGRTSADRILKDAGVNPDRMTISSDGQGSLPMYSSDGEFLGMGVGQSSCLLKEVKECVFKTEIPLEIAISTITSNPADILCLKGKGKVEEGYDADLCILDQELQLVEVIAKGNTVYKK